MTRIHRTSLSIALLSAIGFSTPALAQSQGDQIDAWHSAEEATEAASDATTHAEVAQAAAIGADAVANHPMTGAIAVRAANDPQVVVVPVVPVMAPTGHTDANVTITDHPGNSISPNYSVDFAAMDSNHDGTVVRSEARGNADLMREFHVVDLDNNGRLTRTEMKDWIGPIDIASR